MPTEYGILLPPEAWAVLLACGLAPGFMVCHIVLSRLHDENAPGQNDLLRAAGIYAITWIVAALLIWRGGLTASQSIAGLSTAGFVVLAYMQVYSQIGRGFSLRLLVDVERCGGLDLEGMLREYSDGRGAQWLIDKRLVGIEQAGLAARRGDTLVLIEPRGRWAGHLGLVIKRILKPGQDG